MRGKNNMSARQRVKLKAPISDDGLLHVVDARTAGGPLAAEVKWLEAQLAAARARIVALEAAIDLDPLLDILSRRGFDREFKRALAFVQRYGNAAALLYVDVDQLKPINDIYGHAVGDAVLRSVAATLSRNVRASDVVARLGGDEFAVLLWNIGEAEAAAKAEALEIAIAAEPVQFWGATVTVGASAGVACLMPADQPEQVLERADKAMYARKAVRHRMALLEAAITQ
jgi:diguanylate cyclase (GGDEF)-like protein